MADDKKVSTEDREKSVAGFSVAVQKAMRKFWKRKDDLEKVGNNFLTRPESK